jgi:hypothetical protein
MGGLPRPSPCCGVNRLTRSLVQIVLLLVLAAIEATNWITGNVLGWLLVCWVGLVAGKGSSLVLRALPGL